MSSTGWRSAKKSTARSTSCRLPSMRGSLPSHRGDRFPRSAQEPGSESRRLHAGCRLGRNQDTPQTRPGLTTSPGFDITYTLTTRHQRFACVRLSEPYLTGSRPAFSATLPSRPGEFHPEPLTDPDVILSHHPARATERRLPPSVEKWGSSCCQLTRSQRR
jgi:hypothetical protein